MGNQHSVSISAKNRLDKLVGIDEYIQGGNLDGEFGERSTSLNQIRGSEISLGAHPRAVQIPCLAKPPKQLGILNTIHLHRVLISDGQGRSPFIDNSCPVHASAAISLLEAEVYPEIHQ